MIPEKEPTRLSKFLSLVLRHRPQIIGLQVDDGGWAPVDELLAKMAMQGQQLNREQLAYIVATNSKKRFAFSEDGTKIRASQGHSIAVVLGYAEGIPPAVLYHGTAEKNLADIRKSGLQKRTRQHVHLSIDRATAIKVGQRHGKPVVLNVAAGKMHADGYTFFLANGIWLTDHVPASYLQYPPA